MLLRRHVSMYLVAMGNNEQCLMSEGGFGQVLVMAMLQTNYCLETKHIN